MQDSERDEILWRLDERTEMIQCDIQEVKGKSVKQDEAIRLNRKLATQNRTILNAMTFGIGSVFTAFLGKLSGLFKF